jgi:peptide/nickel transport system ATP-binding protein
MTSAKTHEAVEAARESAVEVRDLTVSTIATDVPIVSGVSFSIPARHTMGLVGESGSGKSTVGVALLGFARRGLRITGGSVRIGGVDILALDGAELEAARGSVVSYVPQDPAAGLNPAHRVGAQLREALEVHKKRLAREGLSIDDRVNQLLTEVRLPATDKLLRSYPHQLSGGQQQRIGIAIAFACRPKLIVLDEPTTGLDVTTQRHILETINLLAETYHASAVYVSHDLAAVAQVAESTAVMYAGRIVEYAPTAELFARPAHPYSTGLLAAAPTPDAATTLVGIEGHPPRPGRWPRGCAYADRCPRATADCRAALPELAPISPGRLVRCIHPLETGSAALQALPSPRPERRDSSPLVVQNLTANYGRAEVLHDVSFEVPRGECTAIVGESGSGKTTLARCLVGLHSKWDGQVRLDGVPLARVARGRAKDQLRRMQYIFQNPFGSLNPTMTVGENIEEPLRHFEHLRASERRARVLETLETVCLGQEFADVLPSRISGGERQRAAVGRALIVGPEILVCDEITSALDVSVQALLVEQLRDLQLERGLSMVFITHNLAVVRSIAQNVIVLEQGHVVERGLVEDVLEKPGHPYTRQLLADLPRLSDSFHATAA